MGGAPDLPLFLDRYGSDENHPVFLPVMNLPCSAPNITETPAGDCLSGSHCETLSFQFIADPGVEGTSPSTIRDWNKLYGLGAIDSTGNFTVGPHHSAGVYPVAIEVVNNCWETDTYYFDVIFTNDEPSFTNCPYNFGPLDWFVIPYGESFSYTIHFEDDDTCDDPTMQIYSVEYYGDVPFLGTISLEGNVLTVSSTESDDGIQIRVEVSIDDGVGAPNICEFGYDINEFICGDVNHLVPVDIDDVVFLISYAFISGPAPQPYRMGDVDCSGYVDIDDIVHIIDYVFGDGPKPCDIDGDDIPDC